MPSGYKSVFDNGKVKSEHRMIWEKHNGEIPDDMLIHHINKNPRDNRIKNLQMVSRQEHAKLHADNTKLHQVVEQFHSERRRDNQNSSKDQDKKNSTKDTPLIHIISAQDFAQESVIAGFRNHLIRQKLSEKTIQIYMNYHERMVTFMDGGEFNQDSVNRFLDKIGSAPARSYLKQLLSFFKNKEIEIPKVTGRKPRKKPNIIQRGEIEQLLEFLYKWEQRYGLMFALTLNCALRKSELLNIDVDDFAWQLWLEDRSKPCRLKIRGKGNKERFVVVPAWLMAELLVYFKKFPQGDKPTFFRIGSSRWDAVFRTACLRCFAKTYKLHEIRHTQATQWHKEGKDIIQIKNRLGHASVSTTQLYINPDEEQEISKWEEESK